MVLHVRLFQKHVRPKIPLTCFWRVSDDVLTCAKVFFSISFHYVRSITFASYDVCGFPCASKCVAHVNGLTRLQWAKVLWRFLVVLLSLGILSPFIGIHMLFGFWVLWCHNTLAWRDYLTGFPAKQEFIGRWGVAIDWGYSVKPNSRTFCSSILSCFFPKWFDYANGRSAMLFDWWWYGEL